MPHIPSPKGNAAPPGSYTSWDDYMTAVEEHEQRRRQAASLDVGKAMRLASDIPTFLALLKGQDVPAVALDYDAVRRYRL